jgi:hypothetical protein
MAYGERSSVRRDSHTLMESTSFNVGIHMKFNNKMIQLSPKDITYNDYI